MMRYARGITLVAGALALAATAMAQVSIEPPANSGGGGGDMSIAPPGGGSPAAQTAPAATAPATLPSAQSILQDVVNGRAGSATQGGETGEGAPLIAPLGPELSVDGLLREGQQIEMRSGRLRKEDAGMLFVFDEKEKPKYPPMGIVPSRRLQAMEDFATFKDEGKDSEQSFTITAEITQYRGKNYLYIKPNGIPVPAPAKPVAPVNTPILMPAAPNVPALPPVPQGNVVTNRIGRLVKDAKTGAELIAFDADGKLMNDPPMGVIPSKYLQVIEDATDHGEKPLKFRLSGEVTVYRGRNYLYLKFVQAVRDLNGGIGAGDNPVMPAGK